MEIKDLAKTMCQRWNRTRYEHRFAGIAQETEEMFKVCLRWPASGVDCSNVHYDFGDCGGKGVQKVRVFFRMTGTVDPGKQPVIALR